LFDSSISLDYCFTCFLSLLTWTRIHFLFSNLFITL